MAAPVVKRMNPITTVRTRFILAFLPKKERPDCTLNVHSRGSLEGMGQEDSTAGAQARSEMELLC